ncbi:hypothetical protein DSM44344_01021 [Mycobacterium marinum]|nr:hypothetical protein DSM44344_01021 [Mycobacterium marinum]
MAANVWPACSSPFKPPVNAATASGNEAPKLACNAADNSAASVGRLNPPTRLAINTCPASNNPLRPPPKLPARFAAKLWPACTSPFKPPVNAATASGNDAPKLACNAALIWAANAGRLNPPTRLAINTCPASNNPLLIWAANAGRLNPPTRLAINTCPASNNPLRPPPKLPARLTANVWPACTRPFKPPVNAATASGKDAPKLACNAALI